MRRRQPVTKVSEPRQDVCRSHGCPDSFHQLQGVQYPERGEGRQRARNATPLGPTFKAAEGNPRPDLGKNFEIACATETLPQVRAEPIRYRLAAPVLVNAAQHNRG